MFGLGKKKPPPIRSLVGEGMVVHGNVKFAGGLRIDGQVIGDVIAEGDCRSILMISDNALVHGKVTASHVIINGKVLGSLHCNELLELEPKARVVGDIRYETLEMHPGATVEGELKPLKNAEKPALKPLVANDV